LTYIYHKRIIKLKFDKKMPSENTDMTDKQIKHKLSSFKKGDFSKPQLAVFVLAFGLIGWLIFRSFAAAPLVASIEAEQMSLPSGGSVVSDSFASAGKAVLLTANGSASGSVSFPSSITSLSVMAKGSQCQGAPTMNVAIDGTNLLTGAAVSSTSWASYSVTPANTINSGTHSLSISFTNDYSKTHGNSKNSCSRDLYVDVANFYGSAPAPTPAPTVTLSASPSSVTAGSASTLTWASANATACTASGAWSGIQPTSGSVSTGALNQNSTYTLTCTGSGGSVSASATVSVTVSSGATGSTGSIYWGAYAEGQYTYAHLYGTANGTWENAPWCDPGYQCAGPKFKSNAGKAPSIEHWGMCWDCSFDSGVAAQVVARGNIPAIDWANYGSTTDADIAAGKYDASIVIPKAQAIKNFGHPVFLLFDEEMNGSWYGYSPGQNGNTSASFVAMWQHIHDVFAAQGVTNVTWAWVPNVDIDGTLTSMSSVYPGDAYVDWTGLNGYNWGTPQGNVWMSFDTVFSRSYNNVLSIAPSKPMMIGEVASEEIGGSKSAWIADMFSKLPTNYSHIKALLWFNWYINEKNNNWSWEMESSSSSQQAFSQGISSPYYAPGGSYGSLPLGTKVPTP
jgi:hypothetical protein